MLQIGHHKVITRSYDVGPQIAQHCNLQSPFVQFDLPLPKFVALLMSNLSHSVLLKQTFNLMYNSTCALLEDFPLTPCTLLPTEIKKKCFL